MRYSFTLFYKVNKVFVTHTAYAITRENAVDHMNIKINVFIALESISNQ